MKTTMRVQIQTVHFDADHKLKEFVDKKINKLNTFYDKIIDSDVILRLENRRKQVKDKVAVVKTQIPGATLVAKESSKVFEESVDLAVDSIRRQLKRHKQKTKN